MFNVNSLLLSLLKAIVSKLFNAVPDWSFSLFIVASAGAVLCALPGGKVISSSRHTYRNRKQLLTAIDKEITARLQQTLHNAVVKTLLKEDPQKQTLRPDIDVKIAKQPRYELPPAANIITVFDQAEGRMLILGAPGSGKTTLLLELADELCQRALKNDSAAVPVLFDLMGWREDKPFSEWLINELNTKYQVHPNDGQYWLESGQIILLLDGLNELKNRQEKCISYINNFVQNCNYPIQLAVCTRFNEYKNCKARLRLKAAILLRPLTETQIREYLINARSRELWHNIETEANLLELAKTPLLLSMMTLAYEEILIYSWKRLTEKEELRQYLFNAYIRRHLGREIKSRKKPNPEKVRHWLIWLAKQMEDNHQAEFSLDNIPNAWLSPAAGKQKDFITTIISSLNNPYLTPIKNLALRLIFWQKGFMPWNVVKILNYLSQQSLVQRVDNRYRFQHKLLQEHFSDMAD